ncbi:MAG: toprim domain-containing protein, partial [Clostridia bacterium]|nr:toprim domain-containing protein [Clostridia bacterium]
TKGKLDYVIIVEGYMDTIALHKAGFKNVVASMGTSLTTEQARLLKRYADLVLICYDGDSAGQNATVRGLEILKENGLEVRIVSLPDGLDPDELIAQRGRDAYEKCLADALPLIDFKLERVKNASDQDSLGGKRKYIEESLQVIAKCESVSLQEELLKKLRDESGLTYESLYRDLEKLKNGDLPKGQATVALSLPNQFNGTKLEIAERFLLCSFINGEPYAKGSLDEYAFSEKFREELAQFIGAKILLKKAVEQDKLQDFAGEENLAELLKILGATQEVDENSREQYFADCKKTLLTNSIKLKIQTLRAEYSAETDREKRSKIATELNALTIKLTKIK